MGSTTLPPSRPRAARVALVFTGGEPPPPSVGARLPAAGLVVAADSGLHHARLLGRAVDLVVGDLDSVDPGELDAAVAAGARVERHPTDKEATDLELALAAAAGAAEIVVVGGTGGRLDHFLANALVLASPRWAHARITAYMSDATLHVARDSVDLEGTPGDLCSLLPVGGPAVGVRTKGLRFPLRAETLATGTTRGVSNELEDTTARVSLDHGTLLVVQPGATSQTLREERA
jgi:thiamine pyrophosphokinase